jgi:2-oxoglutarate ferredoxin oxidoreductase subunit alpha
MVKPASLPSGTYTSLTGNTALAWGLIAASYCAKLPLYYGSYPITPASDILHELARHKRLGVRTFQAEDEIAAVGAAIGASFGGSLAVTGSSGPGVALKSEAISLALTAELPLVVVNVQRAGPSTGMPTKPEQTDLLFALFGRHGESPMPVLACATPSDVVETTIEAARIALKYMTPVILLSDGYIATGSEPWRLPDIADLPEIEVPFATGPNAGDRFLPYLRDFRTMARRWAIPGMPGLEHRIGGLEKEEGTGNVSYDSANHQLMTDIRAWKVANIANDIPEVEVDDPDGADLLVISWGSTYSAVRAGVGNARTAGAKVAHARVRYLSPFAPNMPTVLSSYEQVLIPELNNGQLSRMIKAEFVTPIISYNKVEGIPFTSDEIANKIMELTGG